MKQKTSILFTFLRISLALLLLAWLGYSGSINWVALTGLATSWNYTCFAIVLFVVANLFIAWRLQILINACDMTLSFYSAFKLTFIGLFFNTYLPGATGGDIIKIYYASKGNSGRRAEVVTILILDRIIGLFGLLLLPLLLIALFPEMLASEKVLQGLLGISLVLVLGMVIFTLIAFKSDIDNIRILNWIWRKVPMAKLFQRAVSTIHSYRDYKGTLMLAVLFSLILQLCMIGAMLALAEATNPLGANYKMIILIPLGFLANSLPVTPGGIGVGEVALDKLFGLFGLQGGAEILLSWRLIMVLTGILGLVYYLKGEKRFVFQEDLDRNKDEKGQG